MALLTVERNTPSVESTTDTEEDAETLSGSSSLGFVTTKNFAMCLPQRHWTQITRGDPLNIHCLLKKLVKMMRPRDTLRLCVELELIRDTCSRYLVIVTTQGQQDTEEAIVLGTEMTGREVQIGLVLPIWRDTHIRLDGDGGFIVTAGDRHHVFKTTSVQSMWTALQSLYKLVDVAVQQNYYFQGLSHTWVVWYQQQLTRDRLSLNEWNKTEDLHTTYADANIVMLSRRDSIALQRVLSNRLREIMQLVDLEEVSSKQIRLQLEEDMKMDLSKFKSFVDSTIMVICGQMEKPSKIKDYLYLGSEWNAANFEELQTLGVKYILNCTREIDNFFPDMFTYKNIKVYDKDDSDLMKHWDDTFRFISEARNEGVKVLVHCRMGVSRSAATVIAYLMKMYAWSYEDARSFVKTHRACVNPNPGFVSQLKSYEGILNAMNNPVWGAKAKKYSHKRSLSDPDLQKAGVGLPNFLKPSHLAFDLGSTPNIDKAGGSGAEEPEARRLVLSRTVSSPQCVRDAKSMHMMTFLASLHTEEDDQGITDNTVSESNSSFSSPLSLTPPDQDSLLAVHRHNLQIVVEGESDTEDDVGLSRRHRLHSEGEERRGSHPLLAPKLLERGKDALFFEGKRASAADVLVSVEHQDRRMLLARAHAPEQQEGEREREEEEGEGREQQKLSLSHSVPEDLNSLSLEVPGAAATTRKPQHRRSRSEAASGELEAGLEEGEASSAPVFEPQIDSVQDAVKRMETQASQQRAAQPTTLPAKWAKRVFSAPSLATALAMVTTATGSLPPPRPSSRTSNHGEMPELEEYSEEEGGDEAITFETTTAATTTTTTSGDTVEATATVATDLQRGVTCDSQPPPPPSTVDPAEVELLDGSTSLGDPSLGQAPPPPDEAATSGEGGQQRRREPSHTRSQSNIEITSVRAMINTLEEKARSGSVGSRHTRDSPATDSRSVEDLAGSEGTGSEGSDPVHSDSSRPSSYHSAAEAVVVGVGGGGAGGVKKAQSMSSLGSVESPSSSSALLPLFQTGSSGIHRRRDSITKTLSAVVPSAIPEGGSVTELEPAPVAEGSVEEQTEGGERPEESGGAKPSPDPSLEEQEEEEEEEEVKEEVKEEQKEEEQKEEQKEEEQKEEQKEEVKEEQKEEVKEEQKEEVKEEQKEEVKEEQKEEVKEEQKEEVKEEQKEEVKEEQKEEVKEEQKEEVKEEQKEEVKEEQKEEVKEEGEAEMLPHREPTDRDSVASVLELMQKFESKPHVPQQVKHSFTTSASTSSLNKLLTGGSPSTPLMSDDERSKSESPAPSTTSSAGMASVEVQ